MEDTKTWTSSMCRHIVGRALSFLAFREESVFCHRLFHGGLTIPTYMCACMICIGASAMWDPWNVRFLSSRTLVSLPTHKKTLSPFARCETHRGQRNRSAASVVTATLAAAAVVAVTARAPAVVETLIATWAASKSHRLQSPKLRSWRRSSSN